MKVICALFLILSYTFINNAAPTQINKHSATEEFQTRNVDIFSEEEIIGKSCNSTCIEKLINSKCNETTNLCECQDEFPVQVSHNIGCVKPVLLGEQCMYTESCTYTDPFSVCSQINYKAYCHCITGYHETLTQKGSKRIFCSKDTKNIAKGLPTLLLVVGGVAVLSTLLCFVLKLYAGKPHRYENTPITTRLLSTSEIVHVARSFRQSNRRANLSRRGSHGVIVSSSRATAARAAAILFVSYHVPSASENLTRKTSESQVINENVAIPATSPNSPLSFSAKQFKRESDMKLARNRQLCNQSQSSASSLDQCSSLK